MYTEVHYEIERICPSIVRVEGYGFQGNKLSSGTGVILKDKSILVTDYQIFINCETIMINIGDRRTPCDGILGVDIMNNILIMKFDNDSFPQIQIGNNSEVKLQDKVYAIGNSDGQKNNIITGSISGFKELNRRFRISPLFVSHKLLTFTNYLDESFSGGGFFNSNLELIGIITVNREISGENIFVSVPIDYILNLRDKYWNSYHTLRSRPIRYYLLGRNAFGSENYDLAKKYFCKYLECFPNSYEAWIDLAKTLIKESRLSSGLKCCKKAISIRPDAGYAFSVLAEIHRKQHDYETSIRMSTEGLQKYPDILDFYYNRAVCYFEMHQIDLAKSDIGFMASSKALRYEALMLLGDIYLAQNEYTNAIKRYRSAMSFNRKQSEAYIKLGKIVLAKGYLIEALYLFNEACKLVPNNNEISNNKIDCYVQLVKALITPLEIYINVIKNSNAQPVSMIFKETTDNSVKIGKQGVLLNNMPFLIMLINKLEILIEQTEGTNRLKFYHDIENYLKEQLNQSITMYIKYKDYKWFLNKDINNIIQFMLSKQFSDLEFEAKPFDTMDQVQESELVNISHMKPTVKKVTPVQSENSKTDERILSLKSKEIIIDLFDTLITSHIKSYDNEELKTLIDMHFKFKNDDIRLHKGYRTEDLIVWMNKGRVLIHFIQELIARNFIQFSLDRYHILIEKHFYDWDKSAIYKRDKVKENGNRLQKERDKRKEDHKKEPKCYREINEILDMYLK